MTLTPLRWYDGVAPVEAEVACSGGTHRLVWRRGRLACPDHDLEAERAVVALGGQPPYCVEAFDAWSASTGVDYLPLLAQGFERLRFMSSFRGGSVTLAAIRAQNPGVPPAVLARIAQQLQQPRQAPALPQLPARHPHRRELERQQRTVRRQFVLADLPDTLLDLLCAIVALRAERRWDEHGGLVRHIEQLVGAKAVAALERSLERAGRRLGPRTSLHCFIVGPADPPSVDGWAVAGGAGAALSLRPSWLATVWAPGLAVVDDAFVLAVRGAVDHGCLRVLAARWERSMGRLAPVTGEAVLEPRQAGWSVTWL